MIKNKSTAIFIGLTLILMLFLAGCSNTQTGSDIDTPIDSDIEENQTNGEYIEESIDDELIIDDDIEIGELI